MPNRIRPEFLDNPIRGNPEIAKNPSDLGQISEKSCGSGYGNIRGKFV